ncbi:MAG: polyketide synthase, partial [Gammaproteobacteria bacterium]|nr:polyketide synthase [Gammaproteobacteria bacterium]
MLAAGVNINLHPLKYISLSKARLVSPEGQCKTFDKDANGYVPGDGAGVLLLQRIREAVDDGNYIHGVVKGISVNHSGRSLSLTPPRVEAQYNVIRSAHDNAKIDSGTVSYIEAHGTGASLGDP